MNVHDTDKYYMDIAHRTAQNSYCVRRKVGCIVVKDHAIISHGWNGTLPGEENCCEENGVSKPTVLHAEQNAFYKLAKSTMSARGSCVYVTLQPCIECSKLMLMSGAKRVLYAEEYGNNNGIDALIDQGVVVIHFPY